MSDLNLGVYDLDLTGEHPDNLVLDEIKTLNRRRNIAVALDHGAFYADTLTITHIDTGYVLRRYIDYKLLQPYPTVSSLAGQYAYGIILIHNSIIHQNLSFKYQCVGGEFATQSKSYETYINSLTDNDPRFSWNTALIKDQEDLLPPEKIDTFDFKYLCFCLEKVRNSIIWSDSAFYQEIRTYLESVLESIETQTKLALDSYLEEAFGNFKQTINKAFLGLSEVENLDITTSNEAREAAMPGSRIIEFEANKYITLQSLNRFKERIYERFALLSTTNIGNQSGVVLTPTINSLLNTVNGSVFILQSFNFNTENNIPFDDSLYPVDNAPDAEYTVIRLNNNETNRGGLFIFSERNGDDLFIARHPNGNPELPLVWNKIINDVQTEHLASEIADHLLRVDNPHNTDKAKVGLGLVENLPPVSQSDIMCLNACRKYMTMDAFMLFMKTYLVAPEAAAQDPRNNDTEKVQIIYTAQSEGQCLPVPCPCPEPPAPEPPAPEPEPEVPFPTMVKLDQFYDEDPIDPIED
jgi:hypothetical protein